MQRGQKPKPVALKLIDGVRHLGAEARARLPLLATPTSAIGEAPAAFTADQHAVWARVVEAAPPGLLTGVDFDLLVNYVVAAAARDKALGLFNATGAQVLVKGERGSITNPLMRELRRLAEVMRMQQGELGFTPAARARVTVTPTGPADELERFLVEQKRRS